MMVSFIIVDPDGTAGKSQDKVPGMESLLAASTYLVMSKNRNGGQSFISCAVSRPASADSTLVGSCRMLPGTAERLPLWFLTEASR